MAPALIATDSCIPASPIHNVLLLLLYPLQNRCSSALKVILLLFYASVLCFIYR